MPNSARRLKVDKVQGLQSGILSFISRVLNAVNVLGKRRVRGRLTVETCISNIVEWECLFQLHF